MKSRKTIWSSGLLVGIVLIVLFMMNGGVTQAATSSSHALPSSCTWKLVSSPSPGYLVGVAAVSATDVMAVGNYYPNGVVQTLAEQWNGTAWSVVPSNPTPDAQLNAIARIPGTKQYWAVGQYFDGSTTTWNTLILLWSNNKWSQIPSPNGGTQSSFLTGVTASSANDAWAVGNYVSGYDNAITLAEHWNGTKWSVVSSPNPDSFYNTFTAVTAISSTDAWAVGEYSNNSGQLTLTEHWNGKAWSIVTSPTPGIGAELFAVTRVAGTNQVWAVGFYYASSGRQPALIEQWNGKSWSVITSPNPGANLDYLEGVTAISAKNVWAVGYYSQDGYSDVTLVEHWNGSTWSVDSVLGPQVAVLNGVTNIPHTNKLWSVGGGNGTLTESYC